MLATQSLTSHWWLVLLRGLVAFAFGVLAFIYPLPAAAAFVILFGAFALVDGLLVAVSALRFAHPDRGQWWAMLLQGIVGIGIGAVTFFYPNITWIALGYLVAVWAIATGIFGIGAAIRMRQDVPGEIFLFFVGLLSIAAGIVLAMSPVLALVAWVWVIAIYACVAGVALVALSFRLRSLGTAAPQA